MKFFSGKNQTKGFFWQMVQTGVGRMMALSTIKRGIIPAMY
jgi:hypothetical protein